jgi:hypothetical protein
VCFCGGADGAPSIHERGAEDFALVTNGALGSAVDKGAGQARTSEEVGRDFDSGAPVVRCNLSLSSAVTNRSSKLGLVVSIPAATGKEISGTVTLSGERETGKDGLMAGVESDVAAIAVLISGLVASGSSSIGVETLRWLVLARRSLCHCSLVIPGATALQSRTCPH